MSLSLHPKRNKTLSFETLSNVILCWQEPDPKKVWTYMFKGKIPMRGITMEIDQGLPIGVIKLTDYHDVGGQTIIEAGLMNK